MYVMLGCKNVSDVLYTICYLLMLKNNVCNVSYIVISLHVYNNQMLSYTVLYLGVCHHHVYGRNLL